MMSAPATGCCSRWKRSWSAGGQDEQPSEVKSSTRTGVFVCAEARVARRRQARNSFRMRNGMQEERRSYIEDCRLPIEDSPPRTQRITKEDQEKTEGASTRLTSCST